MAGYVRATWYLHAKYGSRMRGYAGELHGHGADNERHKYYESKERRGVGVGAQECRRSTSPTRNANH